MPLLWALPIGIVSGYLCGGRLSRLSRLRLRWTGLLFTSLIIQLLIFPSFSVRPLFPYGTTWLHGLSYVLILLWLLANLKKPPICLIGLGAVGNFIALAVNGGRMPTSAAALRAAGLSSTADHLVDHGTYGNVVLMGKATRLNWLGDSLYLPRWIPLSTAFSIGDVLIFIGLVWLIVKGMKGDGERSG